MSNQVSSFDILQDSQEEGSYSVLVDNDSMASILIAINFDTQDQKNRTIHKHICPYNQKLVYIPNNAYHVQVTIYNQKDCSHYDPIFKELFCQVEDRNYRIMEAHGHPFVSAYDPVCVLEPEPCDGAKAPILGLPAGNFISLQNTSMDVFTMDVKYTLNSETVVKRTGDILAEATKWIELPNGATDVYVIIKHAIFIKTWRTMYDNYYPVAERHCFAVIDASFFTITIKELCC